MQNFTDYLYEILEMEDIMLYQNIERELSRHGLNNTSHLCVPRMSSKYWGVYPLPSFSVQSFIDRLTNGYKDEIKPHNTIRQIDRQLVMALKKFKISVPIRESNIYFTNMTLGYIWCKYIMELKHKNNKIIVPKGVKLRTPAAI